MSHSKKIFDFIKTSTVKSKCRIDPEIDRVYRKYVSKCDAIKNIESEISILKHLVAHHEGELKKVNQEIQEINSKYSIDSDTQLLHFLPDMNFFKTNARFHNLTELISPLIPNDSISGVMSGNINRCVLSTEETERYIRSCRGDICTGDVVYVGSSIRTRPENGFALVSPNGDLIFHDDLLTIIFDKSINTFNPIPYDFIRERKIKYGNMFHYIVDNKDNNIGNVAYECSFNNWRTNDEIDQIIRYYHDINVWM